MLGLPPDPAIAPPAWWDANAPARRVTYAARPFVSPPPAPWPARRALDFCAALALALAPLHEAGVAHGALQPGAVALRPDGGPLVGAPVGAGGPADDLHGLGVLLLHLLTGRVGSAASSSRARPAPPARPPTLLQGLLADDPGPRPERAREVAARLSAIAAAVPDTTPLPDCARAADGRRARLAPASSCSPSPRVPASRLHGARRAAGPALSPTTVSVPEPPAVTP